MKRRRSLTHVGGAVETAGDEDARPLAYALDVAPAGDLEGDERAHVHGFHTYPARMHPATAARLVQAYAPAGGRVLDPFCGSGTVLIEAMISGRRPLGVDLNPLAVRLARCKSRSRNHGELEQLLRLARACAARADQRRKFRDGPNHRFPDEDFCLFEPHVLFELASLRGEIESLRDEPARLDLSLVLSSLLVKLSRKRGDTSEKMVVRRTAGGFAARLFVRKTEELMRRLAAFDALLGKPRPGPAVIEEDDATELRRLPPQPVDAIVTSPPYAATYDYWAHHALRLRWLGLDGTPFARREFGARATYQAIEPQQARDTWSRELARFFTAAAKFLPSGGPLVLVMADSAVGNVALRADEIVAATARECGFVATARASQRRQHFDGPTLAAFRARPRAEHALLLRRT
jgi:SAM-dependent methyltransferase